MPLRGEVDSLSSTQTDNDRRAIFDEWYSVLDAGQLRESKRFEGGIRLTAVFKHPTNRGEARGVVRL
ncbi:hypothetical protein ACIRP0_31535 [Streptomyces sp. NPDC101733]|uniref:hypothetical protein n=1 Tax=unclassified Streptomyces TaxID=2593676 RepID=UPI00381CF12E